ncbi:MAG TPA: peptide chain release factor N(5)-glutamine methyltransferase [Solirubrobacteraceae bacterium]|nr:peptide chain release factor N(5)-glutamine methyltransferase [Solirubrobacteraceae bacterium]
MGQADEGAAPATVGETLAAATARLTAAGVDTARLDAEVLLGFVLEVDRGRLVVDRDAALDPEMARSFEALVARREAREPVAYILGRRAFRRLELAVDRRVLIPRPETELLVEVALSLAPGARVVDVGTGSGAVALALKDERPDLRVSGADVSADAVAVARANAARLGLEVTFVAADLMDGVSADAVLANLPYVAEGASLAPEIALYEPAEALFAGVDGLDVIRRAVAAVTGPTVGLLALELGPEQADSVSELLWDAGFAEVAVRHDLAGLARVVVGTA